MNNLIIKILPRNIVILLAVLLKCLMKTGREDDFLLWQELEEWIKTANVITESKGFLFKEHNAKMLNEELI